MATALGSVDDAARLNLVEEGESEIGFDHACRLELGILVDADQLLTGDEVLDEPGRALRTTDRPLGTKGVDVAFDMGFELTIYGSLGRIWKGEKGEGQAEWEEKERSEQGGTEPHEKEIY